MFVDDETELLTIARIFFEEYGEFHVEMSKSAEDTLNTLSNNGFDAIISDYQMPGRDGIVFVRAARERFGIILSSSSMAEDAKRLLSRL